MFRLDGGNAFISVACGHLGQTMCRALGQAFSHLLVNGRDADALGAFAAGLRAEGLFAEPAAFDVTDLAALRGFFAARSGLDILVNNAIAVDGDWTAW